MTLGLTITISIRSLLLLVILLSCMYTGQFFQPILYLSISLLLIEKSADKIQAIFIGGWLSVYITFF